ncbi:hypothetical protein B4U80_14172, partial [Leptotrombidium deliense]
MDKVKEKQERIEEYVKESIYKQDKQSLLIIIDQTITKNGETVNSNKRDIEKIKDAFVPLGFHVHDLKCRDKNFQNLTASTLTKRFQNTISTYSKENKYDCLVVFVLSWSPEKNHVSASDGEYIIESLFEKVEHYFVGKPKVFFFRTPYSKEETRKVPTTFI